MPVYHRPAAQHAPDRDIRDEHSLRPAEVSTHIPLRRPAQSALCAIKERRMHLQRRSRHGKWSAVGKWGGIFNNTLAAPRCTCTDAMPEHSTPRASIRAIRGGIAGGERLFPVDWLDVSRPCATCLMFCGSRTRLWVGVHETA